MTLGSSLAEGLRVTSGDEVAIAAALGYAAEAVTVPDLATAAEALIHLRDRARDGDPAASAELADAFAGPLAFGTAGLRGALGPGPARMNRVVVTQAAAGFAAWLADQGLAGGKVIVGHDARHKSDAFAEDTAQIMAG